MTQWQTGQKQYLPQLQSQGHEKNTNYDIQDVR